MSVGASYRNGTPEGQSQRWTQAQSQKTRQQATEKTPAFLSDDNSLGGRFPLKLNHLEYKHLGK